MTVKYHVEFENQYCEIARCHLVDQVNNRNKGFTPIIQWYICIKQRCSDYIEKMSIFPLVILVVYKGKLSDEQYYDH